MHPVTVTSYSHRKAIFAKKAQASAINAGVRAEFVRKSNIMKRLRLILILALLVGAAPMVQSCSSSQETKTVETTTTTDPTPPPAQITTTTTTTSDNEPDSVLGATFHAIGTIIAFPFRLIGDALGLIF